MRFPVLILLLSVVGLSLSVRMGFRLRKRLVSLDGEWWQDFRLVETATLTLLGIIIGFSFSMAVSRYDQRKNYEEEETNAIGTEYLRVELLPVADAAAAKELLKKYLDQRVAWYSTRDPGRLKQIDRDTAQVQAGLWSAVRKGAEGQPTAVASLTVSGMNDTLNRQGYTVAAWLNPIPPAAWVLMETVAFLGSLLLGIGARRPSAFMLLAVPFVISVAFFLIADLDSPRGGLIRVRPQNLINLSNSLSAAR